MRLTTLLTLALTVSTAVAGGSTSDPCLLDQCSAENQDDKTVVEMFNDPPQYEDDGGQNYGGEYSEDTPYYSRPDLTNVCTDDLSPIACGTTPPVPADPEAPEYPDTVSARDLESFTPDAPKITGEPANIGLIGKPTNIVGSAAAHTQAGTLFGFPVFARFTPAGYTFDYGDGTVVTSDTGGTTWASTGQPQFSDAPTAHAYAERGSYTATITIAYSAEVAFPDGIWRPVNGTVSSTASYPVQIYTAKTALVAEDCNENPDAVGCQ